MTHADQVTPVRRPGGVDNLPDVLAELDDDYVRVLALLDRSAALKRLVTNVPSLIGVDAAWVGEPGGSDHIVLRHTVNLYTNAVDGLVVPVGTGLGGQVFACRRPLWVSDYRTASHITHNFNSQVAAEGVKAMLAVPIIYDGEMLGVLYAANRQATEFGSRAVRALEQLSARMATAEVVAERARHAAEVAVHEERRRLALELHDTVGAMLFTLGAGIRRLGLEPNLDEEVKARLVKIEEQAAEASAALRGSLRALNAPPGQVALPVALREHCKAFQERSGVSARMVTLTDLPVLGESRIRALADAAREALLNVEKHAQASSVVVSVFAVREGVAVSVSDDGVGFGEGYRTRRGLGLDAISELLARIGGTLSATSDEVGVTVQAWVPA